MSERSPHVLKLRRLAAPAVGLRRDARPVVVRQGRPAGHVASRPARTPRRSRTCSSRCSSSPASSACIVFAAIIYVVDPVPRPRPGDPEADARQRRRWRSRSRSSRRCILIAVGIPTVNTVFALAKTERHPVRHQRHRPAVVVGVRLPGRSRRAAARASIAAAPIVTSGRAGDPDQDQRAAAHHQPRRHPLVLDPEPQRQARRGARPRPDVADGGRPARHLRRPVHRVLRPQPRQHADGRRSASIRADFKTWVDNQLAAVHATRRTARSRRRRRHASSPNCSRCHQVNGLTRRRRRPRDRQRPTSCTWSPAPRRTSPTS